MLVNGFSPMTKMVSQQPNRASNRSDVAFGTKFDYVLEDSAQHTVETFTKRALTKNPNSAEYKGIISNIKTFLESVREQLAQDGKNDVSSIFHINKISEFFPGPVHLSGVSLTGTIETTKCLAKTTSPTDINSIRAKKGTDKIFSQQTIEDVITDINRDIKLVSEDFHVK